MASTGRRNLVGADAALPVTELSRSRLFEQVVGALLRAIVIGEFRAGARLPTEAELCSRYAVSRTVVREAVRVLQSKGLVEVRHGSGMWVANEARWDPLDIDILQIRFELGEFDEIWRQFAESRRIFEVEIAALAASRRTEAELVALDDALAAMRASAQQPDTYRQADVGFHLTLVRSSHNPVLLRLLEPIHALLKAGGLRPARSPVDALADHASVVAAVRNGDADAARAATAALFPETDDAYPLSSHPVAVG